MTKGKIIRWFLMGVVPLVAAVAGADHYVKGLRYVDTENAYIRAEVITVSSEIDGRISFVNAEENAWVDAGAELLGIESSPLEAAVTGAEADLASARLTVAALHARYREGRAEVGAAIERVRFLETEVARQERLAANGSLPAATFDATQHELALAQRRLTTLRETNSIVLAELGGSTDLPEDEHPLVKRATANLDAARIALSRARFAAPASGHLGEIGVQPGEYVEAGDALFALIRSDNLWIQANLKEVQLTHVRTGQTVDIRVDGFPDLVWTGEVESISPATGSEFALLPPQNASGNWVKVVQRVPVRIRLDEIGREELLRTGMTASISIDTGREHELFELVHNALADIIPDNTGTQ